MRLNLSLKTRIFLLVAIPLIIQLALFVKLFNMQTEATNALLRAKKYSMILSALTDLNGKLFRVTGEFSETKLSLENAFAVIKTVHVAMKDLDTSIFTLKDLLSDEPELTSNLESLMKLRDGLLQCITEMKEQMRTNIENKQNARMFTVLLGQGLYSLSDFERTVQHMAQQKYSESLAVKDEERGIIIALALLDAMLAIVATVALLYATTNRLKKLKTNVELFAVGKPLQRPSSGTDEIDVIDQAFYNTAKELRAANRKESMFINDSQDYIIFLSSDLTITFANVAAQKYFQPGRRLLTHLTTDTQNTIKTFLEDVRNMSTQKMLEITIALGEPRTVLLSALWEPEEGVFLCILHDITERRQIENMRKDLVSMCTHDLKNPLTSISLLMESLVDRQEFSAYREKVSRAQGNLQRMKSLIGDIMDLYKAESNTEELELVSFEASLLCASVCEDLSDVARSANVSLQLVADEETMVKGDWDASVRVLTNLVSNAIKYSPANESVTIRVVTVGTNVEFHVVDRGSGIPLQEQETIFQRFRQGSTSTQPKVAGVGSGLGLAICKVFAEKQGGAVRVTSEPGRGSDFQYILRKSG